MWPAVQQMVVGPEGPDATALTWGRAVLSGKEDIFAFGAPRHCIASCCINRHAAQHRQRCASLTTSCIDA